MSDNRRQLRLEKELREVIGTYLISGFRGGLQGLVSVSRIQASPDMKSAKVFVTVLGTDEQIEASLESLEENAREIQDEVHRKWKLRFTPRLTFAIDTAIEKQLKVEGILRNLEKERAGKPAAKPEDEE